MSYSRRVVATLLLSAFIGLARYADAGMQIEVRDPLYFQRPHEVIFPWADVKLVSFEFASVTDDNLGKQRAKELHDLFLSKIQGLPGGAVLTYITPPGKKIDNYRFTAEKVAVEQKAQMALWGRIMLNEDKVPLINARLILVDPPPGILADFQHRVPLSKGEELPVVGEITDGVSQTRIDFKTIENDVAPLGEFLSGLAFYYKGANEATGNADQLLDTAMGHFKEYLRLTAHNPDIGASAVSNLYLARGHYLLANRRSDKRTALLDEARDYAEKSAALNPYEADACTVQSVILAAQGGDHDTIKALLSKAVLLSPNDANAKYNLAIVQSGQGDFKDAVRQIENAAFVKIQEKQQVPEAILKLQTQLKQIVEQGAPPP